MGIFLLKRLAVLATGLTCSLLMYLLPSSCSEVGLACSKACSQALQQTTCCCSVQGK
jgi:hypothetical protein